jgi:antitoxin YefM
VICAHYLEFRIDDLKLTTRNEDHDPVIVTRRNSEVVVIMSLEDYESLNETAYLLQSPRSAKRLLESIEELESGEAKSENSSNEAHILRERLGGLPLLAEHRYENT